MADEMSCFACRPAPASRVALAPRGLCPRHLAACRVDGGMLVGDVLGPVAPADRELPGELLARLYNPLFVEADGDRRRLRAWASFDRGTLTVAEDRFDAQSQPERWALEHREAPRILELVAAHGTFFPAEAPRRPRLGRPALQQPGDWRWFAAFCDLVHHARAIARRRAEAGHPWPRSPTELRAWLAEPEPARDEGPTIGELDATLVALARRRFP